MRLAGQRWRTLMSHVRLGRHEYRVIRAERPAKHALLQLHEYSAHLSVDRAASVELTIPDRRDPRRRLHVEPCPHHWL